MLTIGMYRMLGTGAIIVSVIGFIWYKIHSLETEVEHNKNTIKELNYKLNLSQVDNVNKDNTISMLTANVDELQQVIDERNSIIVKNKEELNIKIKKLNEWMSKPPKIKYKTIYKYIKDVDYNKATCEEGLLLNESISNINYEDLGGSL